MMHYLKKIILGSNAKSLGLPILGNERGILTLDFIFAMLMMFCFSAIIFAFTITFSAVEIAQYATYASARAFFAARKTSDEQEKAGKDKFTALVLNPKAQLGTFFRNGWFTLTPVQIKDFSDEYSNDANNDSDTFVGARTTLVAKLLKMKFPLLGTTTDEDLSARINSYLSREPTEEECQTFTEQRMQAIQQLQPGAYDNGLVLPGSYIVMMDDGC
ncbi:MAG: hypothetical protein H6623_08795 [Bdellovibrionaceae bacterium]|nr:hypothetical protein [Pseudobdellovibrionaceae bacterium]